MLLKDNHGGLDDRDQSRSRSRTSIVSRLTFENRRDYPTCRDPLFFLGRDFENRDFSVEIYLCRDIYRDRQDLSRSSRLIKTVEIYWEFSRFLDINETFSRLVWDFRLKNLDKLRNLDGEMWSHWLTLDRDWDKLSRFAKIVMSRHISWSRSRLLGRVETKSRFLDLDHWD